MTHQERLNKIREKIVHAVNTIDDPTIHLVSLVHQELDKMHAENLRLNSQLDMGVELLQKERARVADLEAEVSRLKGNTA